MSCLALAVATFWMMGQPAAAQTETGEEIRSFVADLTVTADGRLTVTETIEYFFPESKHGIFRDVPTRYVDDQGAKYDIPVKILGVGDGRGGSWPYQVRRSDNAIRLQIGDPDRLVSGVQTFVISYEADGALRYFADHDELYWNATGTGWSVPILRAAASVRLPENVPTDRITLRCFTGVAGSTDENCVKNVQGSTAEFAASGPLTVVVGWPPGLVAKQLPVPVGQFGGMGALLLWLLPYLVPLFAFAFLFRRWWRHGRDAQGSPTLVVQYDPPDSLPPAEVGAIWDARVEVKEVTAAIVDLAVRGYLKISETETQGLLLKSRGFSFRRLKDFSADTALKPYESKILSVLFGSADDVALSQLTATHAFSETLAEIKNGIYEQTVGQGYFGANPGKVRAKYVTVGIIVASVGFFAPFLIVPALLTGALFVIFGWLMPRLTAKGAVARDHARGFREYLSRAEKYRLEWQEKENIFEKFLPYAMVFGVVDKWSKAFEGLALPQPTWYEGSAFQAGIFNAAAFQSSFNAFGHSLNSAVMSSPSHSGGGSGFGGGGFSGGGGGGGGGGSW